MINDESLQNIEKLHKLKSDGVISEEEFAEAKRDLLQTKPKPKMATKTATIGSSDETVMPNENDWISWAILPLKRYADFEGRSRRKEWWLFQLSYLALLLACIPFAIISEELAVFVAIIGLLALLLPSIAVTVRRFHDQDKSGWFVVLYPFYVVPYIGAVIAIGYIIFMCLPGTHGPNRFGEDPID